MSAEVMSASFIDAYFYDTQISQRKYKIQYKEHLDTLLLKWGFGMPKPSFNFLKEEIKNCEGAKWEPDSKLWKIKHPSLSLRNANILGMLFRDTIRGSRNEVLTNTDPFANYAKAWSWLHDDSLDPGKMQGSVHYYSFDQILKWLYDVMERHNIPYRDYQLRDIAWLIYTQRGMLAYDMGLGKTLMALTVMYFVQSTMCTDNDYNNDYNNFWVIAPKSPLVAWQTQLRTWGLNIKPRLIVNSQASIGKAMDAAKFPPRVLILDESANFKNATAKRTQLVQELSSLMRKFWKGREYIIAMTGTPAPRDPTDWHAQIEIIQPGFIREKHVNKLRNRIALVEKQEGPHGSYEKVVGWVGEEIEAFSRRIDPIRRVLYKRDVADQLPVKIYIPVHLEATPDMLSAAKLIAQSYTGLEARQMLRQLSDGFQYEHEVNDEGRRIRTGAKEVYTPKKSQLSSDLQELRSNEQNRVVIWAGYQESINQISQLCNREGWYTIRVDGRGVDLQTPTSMGKNGVQNWNSLIQDHSYQDLFQIEAGNETINRILSDIPVAFIGNPDAASEGITLHKSSIAIFYSNTDRGDKRRQAEDRIHRLGMDENTNPIIKDYIHLPTDELMLKNLHRKKTLESISSGELFNVIDEAMGTGINK